MAIRFLVFALSLFFITSPALLRASELSRSVLIRDVTQVEGVRDNQLIGYGLVVGLHGTGDRQQTYFTVQTLANAMQRMGVQIAPNVVVVKNVAAVFVTAQMPAFARPGMKLDITISSVGDAQSLEGGVLLLTALRGVDGEVYAQAQGPLTIGGYTQGSSFNSRTIKHPTVGRIVGGSIVERDAAFDLTHLKTVSLLLLNPDFTTARNIASAIDKEFARPIARAMDSRRIEVDVEASGTTSVPTLLAHIQELAINLHSVAKVVVNERTGTIVLGGDVELSPVKIVQGGLMIQVQGATQAPTSDSAPAGTPSLQVQEGASVDELLKGLHAIGASSNDILAILQAIKAAGGLQADLEVI